MRKWQCYLKASRKQMYIVLEILKIRYDIWPFEIPYKQMLRMEWNFS